MSDFTKNVILNVQDKGTATARRSIQKLNSETAKLLLGMEDIASESKKAMETIGLGADAQVTRLQRLSNAFQGFTGKIGAGIGAIDNFAKSLAPWNQALELGGKAIRFLDSGLDAAAKKYPEHAKDIEALRKQFGGLKEDVMAAVGVMTVELLRPIRPLEEMERRVDALRKKLRGEGPQGSSGFRGDNEAGDFWGAAAGRGTFDESTGVDFFSRASAKLDAYTKGVEKAAEAHKKAALEAARWRAEWDQLRLAEMGSNGRARYFDTIEQQGNNFQIDQSLLGQDGQIGAAMAQIEAQRTVEERYRSFQDRVGSNKAFFRDAFGVGTGGGKSTFLESAFGPIDEFNAYSAAFQTLTSATETAMSAWISGSESLGAAIKKGIGTALAGLASSMAVESLKHFAYAAGSLAFGDFRGAGQHAVAGGLFGAGAAAAAVAAKKLGGGGASATASGGGASAGASGGSAGGGGQSYGQGNKSQQAQNTYVIVYGEHFYSESNRMRALDAERFVKTAVGQSFVEHS